MPKAVWNDTVIAEASPDAVEIVEGNVYFPADAVRREYLQPSDTHTVCGWKGTASYYHVTVNGEVNRDAAWYYPDPKDAARNIAGRIAFWKGVTIDTSESGNLLSADQATSESGNLLSAGSAEN